MTPAQTKDFIMDALEAIRQRRTAQAFGPSTISDEDLREALQVAMLAPNHKLTFPWKFVVVGPESRQALKEQKKQEALAKRITPATDAELAKMEEQLQLKMLNPAALVAFCCTRNEDEFRQREDYAAVCCGIQNFTIALAAKGYQTKWSTGRVTRSPDTYELLSVDPTRFEIVGFLWVGKVKGDLPFQMRPPLEAALSYCP